MRPRPAGTGTRQSTRGPRGATIRRHATAIAVGAPVTARQGAGQPAVTSDRTLVVIAGDPEVAVALRERLDRAYVTVRDVDVESAPGGLDACLPWPWMVVGSVPEPGDAVLRTLRHHPILVCWLGPAPPDLPTHARRFDRFSGLAAAAVDALAAQVAGMRLAIGSGIALPGGALSRNAELEALVCNHPAPFALPPTRFRSAQRTLRDSHLGCRVASSATGVTLTLQPGRVAP